MANSKNNAILKFSSMALQMAIVIGAGAWGGSALDDYLHSDTKIWTIVFLLLGVGISLYIFIRAAQNLSKDD